MLMPPPPAASILSVTVSFHTISGMYEIADGLVSFVAPVQYCVVVRLAESPVNSLPPIDVTVGMLPGKSTARPWVALLPVSQSAAPLSPAGATTVCPCVAAWLAALVNDDCVLESSSGSHTP